MEIKGVSDSSHNIDEDDGRITTGHIFYLNDCPITWCSQKQETVALSSCEAEFMAATEAAKQAIWLQDLLEEVTGQPRQTIVVRLDKKSAIALTKNHVFHGRSKHIHKRYLLHPRMHRERAGRRPTCARSRTKGRHSHQSVMMNQVQGNERTGGSSKY